MMTANDIFYILLRHKWKISICTFIGAVAAICFFCFHEPPFQSEAALFIRYVMENSTPGLPGGDTKAVSPDRGGDTIINTEVEILGSMDLAYSVVDVIGVDKVLDKAKGVPKDRDHAALEVRGDLDIRPFPGSGVIRLVFAHQDPTIPQPALNAVVEAYLKKHVEVHRGAGSIGDFLSQETDQLRSRLAQTEDELRKVKDKAGIISLEDAKSSYSQAESRIRTDIFSAQAELAERRAVLDDIAKRSPSAATMAAPPKPTAAASAAAAVAALPKEQVDAYRNLWIRLDFLHRSESQMLEQFPDTNQRVKDVHAQIVDAEAKKQKMEDAYPGLVRLSAPVPTAAGSAGGLQQTTLGGTINLTEEAARLSGLESKIKFLESEYATIKDEANKVDQLEGTISELTRQKELDETNYKYYSTHLEATRIDEALGSGHALNIATVQAPTPPFTDTSRFYKTCAQIGASGLGVGLAWALLIEFYLDRSIRRPSDVERGLQIPLFLSVPHYGRNGENRQVFHETLRDRLIGYFDSKNLTHKPKLVAITGVGRNAGVTTTAAGLAHSLSETGEGNVLLVDMTVSQGSAQQYYKGKAVCGLDELLDTRTTALVQENLYVVGQEPKSDKLSRALPSQFSKLIPQLKASDFDYIIFDMPAVTQISITPRLAGFMDMVLLVVESEHTDRDIARQAVRLLAQSRAHVGAVLNKTRNYLPSKAQHDFLGRV
jgi:succinoglycan biosynthesis transport protein ExoP